MRIRSASLRLATGAGVLGVLLLTGCESPSGPASDGTPLFSRHKDAQSELLREVRQATSRYHSTTRAEKDGFVDTHHCVAVPGLGGMGVHWVNESRVDPFFDPLQPEVLLYAPGPGGQPRLVGIEYIVIDVGQERPSFAGHPFDLNGTPVEVDHWSLHVWLYEENPLGIFVPFNPNVSCPVETS